MMSVRAGATADLREVADLLNDIILAGGTSALTTPLSASALGDWLNANRDRSAWHVATGPQGDILGFQWIGPWDHLPSNACDIGTFVKIGQIKLGIGSSLFEATCDAALDLGYDWINANIRADNSGGLAYYQSRGFRIWDRLEGVALSNGHIVDKILKRYDLRDT
ncbi:GNAT family N-acetyltransferase [Shimia litoralis]|uniref:GNAT family N-acetyltransferase n=1 Tax=Shimia litoralis TaxID=420403 RepID=A0A4U7N122_9RHOB|nr:GNAT family N-acetyltransferase [Shimia litoralis]TKZ19332.1 GNAT family N-acetyltransferase [Shimia litoralis]